MKLFFKNIIASTFIALGLIILFSIRYIQKDPYADFGNHNNYSWKYDFQALGDISTKKLLKSENHYNSFILGSSRTSNLYACYVQTKIQNSKVFHYGNWNESIGGMLAKLKLLDTLGYDIKNVILYLDTDFTFAGDGKCKPYDHYLLTHESKINYYFSHYKEFFSNSRDINILFGWKVDKGLFPNWNSDLTTNDGNHQCSDSVINTYGEIPFTKEYQYKIDSMVKNGFLYPRPLKQEYKDNQISMDELNMIDEMVKIFTRHGTKYYVIITPLYDQLKFSSEDEKLLKAHFGEKNIYDFSGINSYTSNPANFPDRKHFNTLVTKQMIDSVLK